MRNAFQEGRDLNIPEKSHVFIMDNSGRLVFCSDKRDHSAMEKSWGKIAVKTGLPSDLKSGYHMMDSGEEHLYTVRHFKPWNWILFFAMEEKVVHAGEKQIRNATMATAGLCSVCAIAMILVVFGKFFGRPVKRISEAAFLIAEGEKVERIDITSKDELGDLARNMETMSYSIRNYQNKLRRSHDELEQKVKERTMELETALSNIKTLKGLLPICMHCKKIRDDKGYWNQLETYIHEHSDAEFSHGICKECMEKHYGDMDLDSD